MSAQTIFKSAFVRDLIAEIRSGNIPEDYKGKGIMFEEKDLLEHSLIESADAKRLTLHDPGSSEEFQLKNAIIIFDHYRDLTPVQATDARLWTYLSHVTFWEYMQKLRPTTNENKDYILRHYILDTIVPDKLLRNDISLLWWIPFLTHDATKDDPYCLTREVFTMLDYTRHLLQKAQGRNKKVVHGVLEFVIENPSLFSKFKEARVRYLMRKLTQVGGYKVFVYLDKCEIKKILSQFKEEIISIESA